MNTEPLLSARSIGKRYPGVVALDSVDFDVGAGEVHALMGQNGAGKSTLIKVLTGAVRPDAGAMTAGGRPYAPATPAAAQGRGVVAVYQELSLVPTMSVAENICLGRQPRRWWGLDWRTMRGHAGAALAPLGVGIDLARPVGSLSTAMQQLVAIGRALAMDARVLVLDEPTSSLDAAEIAALFRVVTALKDRGLGIVFITHFLDQVYEISDRITVLRNGRCVGTASAAALPKRELVRLMLGDSPEAAAAPTPAPDRSPRVLEVRDLGAPHVLKAASFDLGAGEVLGLAGLLGSGRTEAAELLFGLRPAATGTIRVAGRRLRRPTPRRAIAAGVALSPEDRKRDGLFPGLSIADNLTIAAQRRMGRLGFLGRGRRRRLAQRLAREHGIAADLNRRAATLSGGNQQKMLLARWLAVRPRVLILDEPTRGVDVGGKGQIERIISELAAAPDAGMGVVFISAELGELVRRCGRVLVLRDRAVVGELSGELSQERILSMISE